VGYSDLQNLQVGRAQTTGSRQKLLLATKFTADRGVETFSQTKHVMEDDSISVSSCEIYALIYFVCNVELPVYCFKILSILTNTFGASFKGILNFAPKI
jgi:hypothetical protein